MINRENISTFIQNDMDAVTFEKEEGANAISIYLNDMYLTSLHKSACNERGWLEMENLANPKSVGELEEEGKEVVPFWKRKKC